MPKKIELNKYKSGEYVCSHPSLHEEDSVWKVQRITPLVEIFLQRAVIYTDIISVLDVGGGAGIILQKVSQYLAGETKKSVKKYAIDLSPETLVVQKRNNPDLVQAVEGDIQKTLFADKQFNLVLMIDVLEHVPRPSIVMKEIKRISDFAIFKVPLEDNLTLKIINLVTRDKFKKEKTLNVLGHVNTYNEASLKRAIQQSGGEIVEFYFTNVFEHLLKSPYYQKKNTIIHKIVFLLGLVLNKISPSLAAKIFNDFAVCLVKFP